MEGRKDRAGGETLREHGFRRKSLAVYFLLLAAITAASALAYRVPHVYRIYDSGTIAMLGGADPYPLEWMEAKDYSGWFLYPPLFAFIYYPFSSAAVFPKLGAALWMLLNFGVFTAGLAAFLDVFDPGLKLAGRWYLLALFLVTNELLGAALGGQTNALMAGMMMLGASWYAGRRTAGSALATALACSLKLYPLPLLLLLFLDFEIVFILAAVFSIAVFSLAPGLVLGFDRLFALWTHLAAIFRSDPVHGNYMGLEPMLASFGAGVRPGAFALFALANAALAAWAVFRLRADRRLFSLAAFVLASAFIIVFNKRTEGLTFVLLSPVFAVMLLRGLEAKTAGKTGETKIHFAALIISWTAISYISSDLCPDFIKEPAFDWHIKGLGGMLAYVWALWFTFGLRPEKKPRLVEVTTDFGNAPLK